MSSHPAPGLLSARPRPIGSAMTSGEKDKSGGLPGAHKGDKARAERLRKALRENLKRRKLQLRGRTEAGGAAHDSAGFMPDKSKE